MTTPVQGGPTTEERRAGKRLTMLVPDFPFPYGEFLAHPAGLGSVPADRHGTEVAVVGGGLAGMVAAHELMRLGLRPVVYEADRIGGRMRSLRFAGPDTPVVDLGAMRFPVSARAFYHYVDLLGLATEPFPNPLDEDTPSTVIELAGDRHYARTLADLPPLFRNVDRAWRRCLDDEALFSHIQHAIVHRDLDEIKRLWNTLVPKLDDESFYGFISGSAAFAKVPYRYREIFGQVGFGTGGWDTDFPSSILEVLRVVCTAADARQRRILPGAIALPEGIWGRAPERLVHWPKGTSLSTLHGAVPRPGVTAIRRGEGGTVVIRDRVGQERAYPAAIVTCQTWLLSAQIDCAEELFSHQLWMAIERSHYNQSSKTFVMVDRPFWRDVDPVSGEHLMSMTLTDRLTRGTYLFDDGPDRPASICLSYTWNDDALKWLSLSAHERVRLMLHSLGKIYPGVDIASHIRGEPITVSWEYDPNFMGAFRNNLPGHYRYQRRLFTHFMQADMEPRHRGIFLAGDDISFTPGYAEGAVTTALNAVWGVQRLLGGRSDPANPGPGDRFDRLQPLDLDRR
ncbi:flavin monoamine oxidase family protein [Speluncibacter jeojiensis]